MDGILGGNGIGLSVCRLSWSCLYNQLSFCPKNDWWRSYSSLWFFFCNGSAEGVLKDLQRVENARLCTCLCVLCCMGDVFIFFDLQMDKLHLWENVDGSWFSHVFSHSFHRMYTCQVSDLGANIQTDMYCVTPSPSPSMSMIRTHLSYCTLCTSVHPWLPGRYGH